MGKPGFPTPSPRRGMGKPGFPIPPPAGGSGRASPSKEQPYVHCSVVRRSRMDGCGDHRSPGSAPLPASPRRGEAPGARPRRGRVRERAVTMPAEPRCGRDARDPRACASQRCARIAWTAAVTIVRRVQPPSQPPPAGGRRRVPAPGGGGSGKELSPCPRSRDAGGTPALPGHGHRSGVRHAHE